MTAAKELIALAGRAPECAEKPKAPAKVTISPADARHILVAIDKLPPSFYSTEAYGADEFAADGNYRMADEGLEYADKVLQLKNKLTDYRSELEKSDAP